MEPSISSYLSQALNDVMHFLPALSVEMALVTGLVCGIILAILPGTRGQQLLPYWTGLVILAGLAQLWVLEESALAIGMLSNAPSGRWIQGMSLCVALVLLYPFSQDIRLQSEPEQRRGERYLLILSLLLGASLLLRATHFLMAYLGLEMVSISSYVLVAFTRREGRSAEAGTKFFIYGAFSSGFFLYGISWIYGLTGTLSLTDPAFATGLAAAGPALWVMPVGLVFVGILFKLGAFPFHFWMPDAWEGSTYPVNALLSVVPKAAILIFMIGVIQPLIPLDGFEFIRWLLGLLAMVSMTWGNLAALRQVHMRRLLAYSGVAHSGFLLMAMAIATPESFQAAMFYLSVYAVMNIAIFLMADGFHRGLGHARWQEWEGRGRLFPWATAALAIILASLTGLPPSAGFIAKWLLFISALQISSPLMISLVITGALNTVLALAYYMVIPSRMVFRPTPEGDKAAAEFPGYEWTLGLILGIVLLVGGIWGFDKVLDIFANWF